MKEVFTGNFTQQEPIPEAAIEAAVAVMRSGRLHRYNLLPGEVGEVARLEEEFAAFTGAAYCLAVASGGYALGCALRAVGVRPGERVLTNAFTLAPVPGAIASVGAEPVFVGVTEGLVIDLDDLRLRIAESGARVLMLSHMRGHIVDMDALMRVCTGAGVLVIEDCAHTMGASWNGVPSGRHGAVGCYSTQTYKHINSGEGGLLVTDDPEIAARAVMLSGSYMLYTKHTAAPGPEVFEKVKYDTPNVSGRMDQLRAAILRVQLADLPRQAENWTARYRVVEAGLRGTPGLTLVERPPQEQFVGSSLQFLLLDWPGERIAALVEACLARGVELKWFGAKEPVGFTSRYDSWRYVAPQSLPGSDRVLCAIVDMRLPLTFSLEDCALIARIIGEEVRARAA
ncbi:DegT/DnrJ/EryC1/StrS family aminotransferase [Celeribacter indicus]|uniref:Aminotransferase n=1 Tax=Celeribacter indicus TaxID=1208324 RepID=A0A0B5E485_9RHOB|nr:DegT/DnrJ/EryC1/StrS family aminotransferase [Celeribacter indicus]AJE48165.1 aminotransferase [Celeribacter indicus]SDW34216.1 dTDP-4-amino-4,6-dideoxygalactose transaminase [Celeribacter indicus]